MEALAAYGSSSSEEEEETQLSRKGEEKTAGGEAGANQVQKASSLVP